MLIDELTNDKICIDNKWVIARPIKKPFVRRLIDAIRILTGKADAVVFYKQ